MTHHSCPSSYCRAAMSCTGGWRRCCRHSAARAGVYWCVQVGNWSWRSTFLAWQTPSDAGTAPWEAGRAARPLVRSRGHLPDSETSVESRSSCSGRTYMTLRCCWVGSPHTNAGNRWHMLKCWLRSKRNSWMSN